MNLIEVLRAAFGAMRATKMRSLLTTLGIVIGVAAVITMVGLGSGAQAMVNSQLASLGTDLLSIQPGQHHHRGASRPEGSRLTIDDADALRRQAWLLSDIVPSLQQGMQAEFGAKNSHTEIVAVPSEFMTVHRLELVMGRNFTYSDDQARRLVAVVGDEVPREFGVSAKDMLGKEIVVRGMPFEVIGVLGPKGDQPGGYNPDESAYIPLRTGQYRIFGSHRVREITARLTEPDSMEAAFLQIERILRRERRLRPDEANDFRVQDRAAYLMARAEASATLTNLLAGIGAVSLMVGGIGIMNIMLVSVTERTREIGIRKALGATRRQVLLQFLVEALALCLLGGLLGVALGLGTASLLSNLNGWDTIVSPAAIGVAVSLSLGVGLFFGVWPARRASRLDPIEALRYE